jgi:hypothetical protein
MSTSRRAVKLAPVGPEAEDHPERDDHDAGHLIAGAVAEQRADERRTAQIASERKRSETRLV